MILTGKAKRDFYRYLHKEHGLYPYNLFNDPFSLSIIIEWLDEKEYRGERLFSFIFGYYFKIKLNSMTFNDVVKQTIEKCNEIYNNLNQ